MLGALGIIIESKTFLNFHEFIASIVEYQMILTKKNLQFMIKSLATNDQFSLEFSGSLKTTFSRVKIIC